ncbi:MAG TPA: phospholipid carrier-dependent glycosyltransferase [Candidatus Binataceae bacterium]
MALEARGALRAPLLDLLAVLALAAIVFYFRLGRHGLWEPDEARYAEIAREMLQSGNFIVPHLNYVAYVEKPPLLYWLTALSFSVFGLTEFAARFFVAFAALIGVLATFVFSYRSFGRRHALLASAILATSPLYAVMAQVLTTDMLLASLTTVALFGFFLHWRESAQQRRAPLRRQWWCWTFYIAIGLAVLAKGPIGAVLPILSAIVFLLWQRETAGSLSRFHVFAGLTLTFLIAAPWFMAMTIREPGFFDFYFIGEHLRRAFEYNYSHSEPIYFYIPVLVAGLLPWSMLAPFLTWRAMRPNPARRFAIAAAGVIFVVFSMSSGKLIPYILPAIPPLAVLIADGVISCAWPDEHSLPLRKPDSRILVESGPMLIVLGAGTIIAGLMAAQFRSPYLMIVRPALYGLGAILIVGGTITMTAFLMRKTATGIIAIALTAAAAILASTSVRLDAEPVRCFANLSKTVAARAPDATLICYHRYPQSLAFYTRRRVIVVGEKSELRFGAERAGDAAQYFFATDAELRQLWQRPGPIVLVLDESDLKRLASMLGNFRVIAAEGQKRAVMKIS